MQLSKTSKGFTLIELGIVIVGLGIVFGVIALILPEPNQTSPQQIEAMGYEYKIDKVLGTKYYIPKSV